MNLWPHQDKAMAMLTAEFKKGHKSVCVVMSTGAGKSRFAGHVAAKHLEKVPNGKVLWMTHREELLGQGFRELESWGLSVGAIAASTELTVNPFRPVQIASVQTLLARNLRPEATLVIPDEMHHYASDKWSELLLHYRRLGIPMVGLTATPIRGDGRGFEGIMDSLVCPITMRELIEQGFLVPYELKKPPHALRNDEIAQDPHVAYLEHAAGRKAIVFAGNIKAAQKFTKQFNDAEIPAGMVWGEMDAGHRRDTLERYSTGQLKVLINIGVLTEGFDDRETSCVILARAIGTLSLFLQTVGRALRVCPEKGKTDAIILDLHGSTEIHGEPADDREWTLEGTVDRKPKLERPKERFCFVCKVLLEPDDGNVCALCGIARPEAAPPDVVNVALVKYASKLREPPEVRRKYFEKLRGIAKAKNYDKNWASVKFRVVYNEWPPRAWMTH